MAWNATRTSRNTLHVINDQTGVHFEAQDEQEVNDTIAALKQADEAKQAEQAAVTASADVINLPVGEPTQRAD